MVYGAIVEKSCARSQGQPLGARSRAITLRSAVRACSASVMIDAEAIEREQHAGGGAPDVAVAVGDVAELCFELAVADEAARPLVVAGFERVGQRDLEGVLDFGGIQEELETRSDETDDGGDEEAADDDVVGEIARHRDEARFEADFFARF